MRIVQINTVYRNGGSTGKITGELFDTINEKGHEAFMAFGYGNVPKDSLHEYRIESNLQLLKSKLSTRFFGRHGFYNFAETRKLISWLDEIKPDIIHLHNIHNHYVNVEILFDYLKECNTPVVWTLHDCWSFTGWCAYFDFVECEKWKTGCHQCPNIREYPFTWFFDRSKQNYENKKMAFSGIAKMTIITPSIWLKDLVKQSFLKEYPIEVINNGIDLTVFRPCTNDCDCTREQLFREKYHIKSKKIILGVAMNMSKRKGIDTWMRLSKTLNPKKYSIVLIGISEKNRKLFDSNVICIERVNNQNELAEIYSLADVFVNPTLEDNYPTTNLESIACGTPVITYRTGGSPESIVAETGIVVSKDNFQGLCDAIETITEHGKEMYRVKCRQYALQYFGKTLAAMNYFNIYNEIMR